MNARDRKHVLVGLALVCVALFGLGIAYWIVAGRHHHLCPGGKTPIAQQDVGMGQIVYKCPGGYVTTGSFLP